jgi:membrane protein implicated in regulation of membrane protease activity
MFSMSMFDFSAPPGSASFVNSNFWVYWAVTIPLTLAVLTIFRLWMSFQREMKGIEGESLKQERTMVVQSMHEANLALNTPFYPGKGLPGHIF